jgi:hypothetical protein
MDVEKTMEFLLAQQARFDAQMSELTEKMNLLVDQHIGMEERHDREEERHDREIADIRAVAASTRVELRRGIRLSVEEQRRERVRRQALDDGITKLAAAQVITEEKLQKLIDSLRRNGNN